MECLTSDGTGELTVHVRWALNENLIKVQMYSGSCLHTVFNWQEITAGDFFSFIPQQPTVVAIKEIRILALRAVNNT